ncbi:M20/M25/M40 family metallo-hydrolase [Sphingosinicellaceae bacterium]|nr:M20/M25/M40 family metallo-hydrolase [Sphingosinicellaceae bacterium]
MRLPLILALLTTASATAVAATPVDEARAILKEAVETPTVAGRHQVPVLAETLRARLVAAGFASSDVVVQKVGDNAILSAVYRGTGKARPIAVIGHMDVVEADPKDWTRDPFKLIEEGGYLFGRGVFDNKFDVSMIVETLIRLKAEGFKPRRDIILYLSGDEETAGTTAAIQAKQAKAANVEFVLNGDSGGGLLDTNGKPLEYNLSAAEKSYADFQATVTNPGGHSSLPTTPNAIVQLAAATERMAAHQFPAQLNDITRASLKAAGTKRGGALGAAMVAFAANPTDAAAIATLRGDPETIGQIGTTCVPTMINGGHAPNALPQRVTVNINCRIFPGIEIETIRQALVAAAADPAVTIKIDPDNFPASPPSPLRPDVVAAVDHAVHGRFPGFVVVPGMDAGASDSVFYRALGIPSYGVSGMFIKGPDVFIHGLNERIPVDSIAPALAHWHVLLTDLSK